MRSKMPSTLANMAGKKNELGPTGLTVGENVKRFRLAHGWEVPELAERLHVAGRTIPALGIRRIEAGERRVDVDDLVALAFVLQVDVPTMLLPQTLTKADTVELTGASYPSGGALSAGSAWAWLRAELMSWGGPDTQQGERFQQLGWPRWDRRFRSDDA